MIKSTFSKITHVDFILGVGLILFSLFLFYPVCRLYFQQSDWVEYANIVAVSGDSIVSRLFAPPEGFSQLTPLATGIVSSLAYWVNLRFGAYLIILLLLYMANAGLFYFILRKLPRLNQRSFVILLLTVFLSFRAAIMLHFSVFHRIENESALFFSFLSICVFQKYLQAKTKLTIMFSFVLFVAAGLVDTYFLLICVGLLCLYIVLTRESLRRTKSLRRFFSSLSSISDRKVNLTTMMILGFVSLLFLFLLTNTWQAEFELSARRKSIVAQIRARYQVLQGQKTVFYITGNGKDYEVKDLKIPFDVGFGVVLMDLYSEMEHFPKRLLSDGFLQPIDEQGYREYKGQGFGYYYSKSSLESVLAFNYFGRKDIIALSYDENSGRIQTISSVAPREIEK